jgi:hypothetical protein
MRTITKVVAVVSLAASGVLLGGPAQAASESADYGQHVRTCTQSMGFDGTHNPGMHQGTSGWDPSHECTMH